MDLDAKQMSTVVGSGSELNYMDPQSWLQKETKKIPGRKIPYRYQCCNILR